VLRVHITWAPTYRDLPRKAGKPAATYLAGRQFPERRRSYLQGPGQQDCFNDYLILLLRK